MVGRYRARDSVPVSVPESSLGEDLATITRVVDALDQILESWEELPEPKRRQYAQRWEAKMHLLEGMPERMRRGVPNFAESSGGSPRVAPGSALRTLVTAC